MVTVRLLILEPGHGHLPSPPGELLEEHDTGNEIPREEEQQGHTVNPGASL